MLPTQSADADGGGQMNDPVAIGGQGADERRVLDPAMHENRLARRHVALDIGRQLWRGAVHLRIKAIQDDDRVPAFDQQIDRVRADEAGTASDKYFHAIPAAARRLY